jgi:mycothiol S-conjugate amidase
MVETRGHAGQRSDSLTVVSERPTILTVHAHPDDEASKGAPTLAKYGAAGARTILVCCTGGEEGDLQNPSLREPGQAFYGLNPEQERDLVARMRMSELRASADVIGFDEVVMLGYRDSGMADSVSNDHPACFHQADIDEATGRLVDVIRRTRPQVVITYGDDQRAYPHPDHLRVHDISVLAFDRASDPAWYPDAGPVHQVSKLYYAVWSRARLVAIHEALLERHGESPFDEKWFERPDLDHRVTTRIEVAEFMWARTQALLAHATQIDPSAPFWFGLSDDEFAEVYPWEDWILARTVVGDIPAQDVERDLFDGVAVEIRSQLRLEPTVSS